jgi:lactoylglutathione lyase
MKRLHIHVTVRDLAESIQFYATLFGGEPTVRKDDYAKWLLDDPRVNFAISTRGHTTGVDHLGIQVDDATELHEVAALLQEAQRPVVEQSDTVCCYARSAKAWVTDPQGLYWETFHTLGEAPVYGEDRLPENPAAQETACCAPRLPESATCCDAKTTAGCC